MSRGKEKEINRFNLSYLFMIFIISGIMVTYKFDIIKIFILLERLLSNNE